ncbi:MAG: terminase [Reyranella sp.]|nr:terminase [Reyranella sp.]
MSSATEADRRLHREIGALRFDPLGFVMFAFPWGMPGPLAAETGPEPWQARVLVSLGEGVQARGEAVRSAIASGHGVGKSALVAWIILWALSTRPGTRGVVSANTEGQLRTKTWPELAKWHGLCLVRDWFAYTATSLHSVQPGRDKIWRVDAVTWSENNTEAIAGLHNKGRRAFVLLDEASAIPDAVWETIEGALTDADTELLWAVFGNPTRNTGRFRECFPGGRFAHRWQAEQVDSRSVSITNKGQISEWVKDYGEDSDFVRVRVRGQFPRAGTMQFIDSERVEQALTRELVEDPMAPLIMGIDIARSLSGDKSVIRFRRGLDARSIPAVKFRIADLMLIAGRIMELVQEHAPDAVFLDSTGIGWGVHDRLVQLGCPNMVGVDFGGKADREGATARYANKRAEMWGFMKDWCAAGCLPDDRDLVADLTGVEYGYDSSNALLLERKQDMRRRGLASPDDGDALALTFAYPAIRRDWAAERRLEEKLAKLKRWVV